MKFIMALFLIWAATLFGAPTSIRELKLTSDADANGYSITNLHSGFLNSIGGASSQQLADVEDDVSELMSQSAYWPPDATASSWFGFVTNSGYITLTSYNIAGGVDVVIPDFINGLPVGVIGSSVFSAGFPGKPIKSLSGANKVTSIRGQAFSFCTSLALASFPQVTNMGHEVFFNCSSLKSVIFGGNAPTIVPLAPGQETFTFGQIASNQVTVFAKNPLSTGWGATLDGMPVVRPAIDMDLQDYQTRAYWPPDATPSQHFVFTTNGADEIVISGYDIAGGTSVVVPEYINGLPVVEISTIAFGPDLSGRDITSISGGGNLVTIGDSAFDGCGSLTSVSLNSVQSVGIGGFIGCTWLSSVSLNSATAIGESAFSYCYRLESASLYSVASLGSFAFELCTNLTSIAFASDAPTVGETIFLSVPANQVALSVTDPTAIGWGSNLGGMPVTLPALAAGAITLNGERVASTNYVAEAIAAIPIPPEPDLSARVAVNGGAATNLSTHGWLALPQTQATNLTYRLVTSNDVILAIGVLE